MLFAYSSAEDPGGVKAYFVLRFRAVGKFLGKLMGKLGPGAVSAAGKFSVNNACWNHHERSYAFVRTFFIRTLR